MSQPNNPLAFPRPETEFTHGQAGMTLRDWFAGQALAGLVTHYGTPNSDAVPARIAYELADAMLAERVKGLPPVEPCEPQSPQQVRIVPLAELR